MGAPERDEREILMADAKTATLAGGGLGFSFLGVLAIPVFSLLGVVLAFFALRTARPEYRVGRIAALVGLVVGIFGVGAWLTLSLMSG